MRDLTAWIARLAEDRIAGTFNATGPEARLSVAEMVYWIRAVTGSAVHFNWVGTDCLREHEVQPWSDLPVWIPDSPLSYVTIDRAVSAGLTFGRSRKRLGTRWIGTGPVPRMSGASFEQA